jgi:hypothetical protein
MKVVDPNPALIAFVSKYRTKNDAAAVLGISASYLQDILKGNRRIPTKVIEALGLKQVVVKS